MSPKTILEKDPIAFVPMTTATIDGKDQEVPAAGKTALLFTIYGRASDVRSGESHYGGWTAIVGNFEAIRASDGKTFSGGQCFLPEPLSSMMASNIRQMDSGSVDFALKVYIKCRPDLARGYEYIGEPIKDPSAADPLESLRKMAQRALPAPGETESQETREAEGADVSKPKGKGK